MMNLVPDLYKILEERELSDLNHKGKTIFPAYDGNSIMNIVSGVCHWMNIAEFSPILLNQQFLEAFQKPFQNVFLLVMDGVGLNIFDHILKLENQGVYQPVWNRILQDALLAPLTSVSPSTTASALTSLWTGRPPVQHGIMGYEMWLKTYGLIANMIKHSTASYWGDNQGLEKAGFKAEEFLTLPTFGTHLVSQGVKPYSFLPADICKSGLSRMLMRDFDILPYISPTDLWVSLSELFSPHPSEKTFTSIYWPMIDTLGHIFGPKDVRLGMEFNSFSQLMEKFIVKFMQEDQGRTLFLVTADHGMIHTPPEENFNLKKRPGVFDRLLMPPFGDHRLAYVFNKGCTEEEFSREVEATWPDCFSVRSSQELVRSGLFGSGQYHHDLFNRIGDQVIISRDSAYLNWSEKEINLLGRHGGLSVDEMLVPFIALEI
ncbi:MAG: alkaline phosphatase family protein [Anaerolineaceae bacterium]|nr:alkaline phosphatase family protein [Anaerolineaceae bacterium]